MSLLRLENVVKTFYRGSKPAVHAVNGVSLTVEAGETLALIGESGSGKSTLARLAVRLLAPDSGNVAFNERDLSLLGTKELRTLRADVTVVFQEPYQSLNPRMTVAATVGEPLTIHERQLSRAGRRARTMEALEQVALDSRYGDRYPYQLSGGQQQRVGIARAIVTRPKLIILDEPTSSLDLSVRAQILELLRNLQQELNLSYLFISHDINTVEYFSDRVAVMYRGEIVESGPVSSVFNSPKHPYTQALVSSALSPDPDECSERILLVGEIPSPTELPTGCSLFGRCPIGSVECAQERVPLRTVGTAHAVACIKVRSSLDKPADDDSGSAHETRGDASTRD